MGPSGLLLGLECLVGQEGDGQAGGRLWHGKGGAEDHPSQRSAPECNQWLWRRRKLVERMETWRIFHTLLQYDVFTSWSGSPVDLFPIIVGILGLLLPPGVP